MTDKLDSVERLVADITLFPNKPYDGEECCSSVPPVKEGSDVSLRLLESGYWHYRRNANQFAQWPKGRECEPDDCFGWDRETTAKEANIAAREPNRPQGSE